MTARWMRHTSAMLLMLALVSLLPAGGLARPRVTLQREQVSHRLVERVAQERRLHGVRYTLWRQAFAQVLTSRTARFNVPVERMSDVLAQPGKLSLGDLVRLLPEAQDTIRDLYTRRRLWLESSPKKLARAWKRPYSNAAVFLNAYRCQGQLGSLLEGFEQAGVTTHGAAIHIFGSLAQGTFTAHSDVDVSYQPGPRAGKVQPPVRGALFTDSIYTQAPQVEYLGREPTTPGQRLRRHLPRLGDDLAPALAGPLRAQRGTIQARLSRSSRRKVSVGELERDPHLLAGILDERLRAAGTDATLLARARRDGLRAARQLGLVAPETTAPR